MFYVDGFYTPPALAGPSWLAVRYQIVNPGVCPTTFFLIRGIMSQTADYLIGFPDALPY